MRLSTREHGAVLLRATKRSLAGTVTDSAAAVAYYLFLAIPAMLLVAVGVFSVFAGPAGLETVIAKAGSIAPPQAVSLLEGSLRRTIERGGGSAMIGIGGAIALWTSTGAMMAVMRALNAVQGSREARGFLRQRLTALVMVFFALLALALVFALLILGPKLSVWIGSAVGMQALLGWVWWTAQWPILVLALLLAFAVILYVGPSAERRVWRFGSFGASVAVVVWLTASGAFGFYVSRFGSYEKTWGSLTAAIILLTWLWLSALSLLLAAEIDAEVDRTTAASPHAATAAEEPATTADAVAAASRR